MARLKYVPGGVRFDFQRDGRSAFAVVQPCICGEHPSLFNFRGVVYFRCDECIEDRGKPVPEAKGAAMEAAARWNQSVTDSKTPRSTH